MTGESRPEDETEYDRLIRRLAEFKADLSHAQEAATAEETPFEVQSKLAFLAADFDTLMRKVVAFIEGEDGMPDECPVCGEPVEEVDELEAGESYDAERVCVRESSPGGPGHGIVHFSGGGQGGGNHA